MIFIVFFVAEVVCHLFMQGAKGIKECSRMIENDSFGMADVSFQNDFVNIIASDFPIYIFPI